MNNSKKNIIYRLTDGKSVADWCRNYNVLYSSVTVMLNKVYYHNKQHNGKYITINDIKKDLENVDN